jgi:hypothetical protein
LRQGEPFVQLVVEADASRHEIAFQPAIDSIEPQPPVDGGQHECCRDERQQHHQAVPDRQARPDGERHTFNPLVVRTRSLRRGGS